MTLEQTTVFGDPLETLVTVETTGRVLRPFRRMCTQIADEYRVHCEADGLRVSFADAAKVIAFQAQIHASAFESYTVQDGPVKLGIPDDQLGSALQHARYSKSNDDTLVLRANEKYLQTHTQRTFGKTGATVRERVALIDEKSVRSDFEQPELEYDESVSLSAQAIIQTINALQDGQHIQVSSRDSGIAFSQDEDIVKRDIELACETESDAEATYSTDMMSDVASALNASYADSITVSFATEFPFTVSFEREGVYEGVIKVAPRIEA